MKTYLNLVFSPKNYFLRILSINNFNLFMGLVYFIYGFIFLQDSLLNVHLVLGVLIITPILIIPSISISRYYIYSLSFYEKSLVIEYSDYFKKKYLNLDRTNVCVRPFYNGLIGRKGKGFEIRFKNTKIKQYRYLDWKDKHIKLVVDEVSKCT